MQKKYIIRNIHGSIYTTSLHQYYPFINPQDHADVRVYNSEQEALDDIGIIISQYMSTERPLIELVPVYTH